MLDGKDEDVNGVDEIDDKLRKLYIGGLSDKTTDDSGKEYFGSYGEVSSIKILRKEDGSSRKFGFVTFASEEGAKNCLQQKKKTTHKLDEKEIDVKRAMPRGAKDRNGGNASLKTQKIFIGGLDTDVEEDTIKSYFEDNFNAEVVKIDFIKEKRQDGKEQKRRRFCFVTLSDTDLVDELCIIHYHEVNGAKVEVKKAEPKGSKNYYYGGFYPTSDYYRGGPQPYYNQYNGGYNGPPGPPGPDYYNGPYGYDYNTAPQWYRYGPPHDYNTYYAPRGSNRTGGGRNNRGTASNIPRKPTAY